jgi:uncharacterized protein (TIGR02001 family)
LFALGSGAAAAQEHTFSGNVALYSEYEYRGLTQTWNEPALQLRLDYANRAGFYAGTFLSNVTWLKDTADYLGQSTDARVEWDLYGGYKWTFVPEWTLDLGAIRYEYPNSNAFPPSLVKPNTTEVYAGIAHGPATLRYSYATGELFGVPGSKGSDYLELEVSYPVMAKLAVGGVLGRQRYKGTQPTQTSPAFDNGRFNYTVWKLGVTYDFGSGWTAGAYYKDTNADPIYFTQDGRDYSRGRLVGFARFAF